MPEVAGKLAMRDFTAETFRPLLGRMLRFRRPTPSSGGSVGEVDLELLEVNSHNHAGALRAPFSLLFVLPDGVHPLGQGLHRLMHESFDSEEWYLSRVSVPGLGHDRAYYEAVFA
jgi:uncharacterized protein DUF6916